jgi:prepilin-type N-terminal cleavage/methylation domain-containing protein
MQRGMTLIEMAIGLVIVGLLLVMALPGFGTWLQNSQIRNAAESLQNGLQLTRAEAVRRNTRVQFVLGSVLGGGVAADRRKVAGQGRVLRERVLALLLPATGGDEDGEGDHRGPTGATDIL